VDALLAFIDTDGTVDQYLADQLILPLSIAEGPSAFRTSKITHHLMTNAAVIRSFLPARIELHGALGEPGVVQITPEISR
jgi:RNA 3'-terminal phosphate cyclase (ATP)